MIAKDSRAHEPIENIDGDEQPTICIHCGSRTEIVTVFLESGNQEEVCLHCGQTYEVEFEMESESDEFACASCGARADIKASIERDGELCCVSCAFEHSEATRKELDHLFDVKPSSYEDFGSF